MNQVVVLEFCQAYPIDLVILLIRAKILEILLNALIHPFCLTVGLRMICH